MIDLSKQQPDYIVRDDTATLFNLFVAKEQDNYITGIIQQVSDQSIGSFFGHSSQGRLNFSAELVNGLEKTFEFRIGKTDDIHMGQEINGWHNNRFDEADRGKCFLQKTENYFAIF